LITVFTLPGVTLTPVPSVLSNCLGLRKILVPALLLFGIAATWFSWRSFRACGYFSSPPSRSASPRGSTSQMCLRPPPLVLTCFAKASLPPNARICPNAGKAGGRRAWVTVCYLRDAGLEHASSTLIGLSPILAGAAPLTSSNNIGRLIAVFGELSTTCCG
jgi:hypothetical protein